MGKKLVITGADFSQNAVEYQQIELPLITSAENQRTLLRDSEIYPDDLVIQEMNVAGSTWYSYVVDVSQYVGETIRISAVNGYSSANHAYGGFMSSLADKYKTDGFSAGGGLIPPLEPMGEPISTVMAISSEENNVFVTKEYTIPAGAQYLVFACKTSALGEGETPKAVLVTL